MGTAVHVINCLQSSAKGQGDQKSKLGTGKQNFKS